jgi:NADH-quinone oxidoreductase subunit F
MDFESMVKVGSRLGTGTMIVLDDHTCPIGMMENLERFFAQESCGWCTPCWAGLRWIDRILVGMEEGTGKEEDLAVLETHARRLGPGNTFCALAPGAAEPLQSGLKYFRDDFEQHIHEHGCPWRRK